MFGIGGGELIFILFIVLMLFGSDKIPSIAKNLGKIMAQVKNATNDIKSEIQKSAEESGIDKSIKDLTSGFTNEIDNIKNEVTSKTNPLLDDLNPIKEIKEDIESISGPIKRQL